MRRGSVFALLGPNGAGKTTTIKILSGLLRRDGGEVDVLGYDPHDAPRGWRALIGLVSQDTGLAEDLRVREMLRQFTSYYPNPRELDDLLTSCGLEALADCKVAKLSGGQRRRVDVAIGLAGNPEVIFLDEPTTGFDPEARREFWNMLSTLPKSGVAIFLTTHYIEEAEYLADDIAIVVRGRIVTVSDKKRLLATRPTKITWLDSDGVRISVTDPDPQRAICQMTCEGTTLAGLSVIPPSLEQIYLESIEDGSGDDES